MHVDISIATIDLAIPRIGQYYTVLTSIYKCVTPASMGSLRFQRWSRWNDITSNALVQKNYTRYIDRATHVIDRAQIQPL